MVKYYLQTYALIMAKRITKVTTKKGDAGSTGMGDGSRVSKSSSLIVAIGELDELNSWIGLLTSLKKLEGKKDFLLSIQNRLFDIGGILTTKSKTPLNNLHLESLEEETNNLNKQLPHLENFVLPGGNKDSSVIHITRTVCRRAERSIIKAEESNLVEKSCLIYLNRLSDFLFVLARKVNFDSGVEELLWSQE